MDFPLAWERLVWRGRSRTFPPTEFAVTDIRVVTVRQGRTEELTLYDVGEVEQTRSWLDRVLRTSTLIVHARDARRSPLTLEHVREADLVAALLELVSRDPSQAPDLDAVRTVGSWKPPRGRRDRLTGAAGVVVALLAVAGAFVRQRSTAADVDDDSNAPRAVMGDQAEMIGLMEDTVMPWARATLAPIVGGADRVRCETCHGESGREHGWRMPAVAALPEEAVRDRGWEQYSDNMDPQLRNAIYGYGAESGKQTKATYMREIVMPGMARLLSRPTYDYTRTYDFNRRRQAFGCYHCHKVR